MVFRRNKNRQELATVPVKQEVKEVPHRVYFDPEREATEQRVRREIAMKHKAGDLWRARHCEELIGVLRDPNTPHYVHQLVEVYTDEWKELDDAIEEEEEIDEDIRKTKEPLARIKYQQYKDILKKNISRRMTRLAKLRRLLEANKIFPEGLELLPEKEYRDLGIGKVFAASESTFIKRKRSVTGATVTRRAAEDAEEIPDFA